MPSPLLQRWVALLSLLLWLGDAGAAAAAGAIPPHFLPCHHDPPLEAQAGQDLVLDFAIPDYAVVRTGLLYVRFTGEPEYVVIPLVQASGELYTATVPADQLRGRDLEYYVLLLDRAGRQHHAFAGPNTPQRVPIVGLTHGAAIAGQEPPLGAPSLTDEPADDLAEVFAVYGGADVVVGASKRVQKVGEAPAAVFVLTADDLRYAATPSIGEVLRLAPGAEVYQISPTNLIMGVRGLTSEINDKVLVLIDGREINLDLFGVVFWEMLPISIEEIERVEVIRGPGSTLHGANAYSGVVNIVTRERRTDGLSSTMSIRGGGTGAVTAHGAVYGKEDWLRYTLSAGYDKHNAWWNSEYAAKGVAKGRAKLVFEIAEDMDLTLEGGLASAHKSARARERSQEQTLRDAYRRARSDEARAAINRDYRRLVDDQYRGGAKIYTGISEIGIEGTQPYVAAKYHWDGLDFRAYWNRLDAELTFLNLDDLVVDLTPFDLPLVVGTLHFPERIEGSGDTFDAEVMYTTPEDAIPYNRLTVGGNGRLIRFEGTSLVRRENTEKRAGVFLQDELKLWDMVVVTAGIRLDFNDITPATVDGVSPKANITVNPYGDHFLRVGFGSAFRKPSFLEALLHIQVDYEEAVRIPNLAENIEQIFANGIGNPDLKNEKMYSIEFGYLGYVWDKRLKMNLDVFYTWYIDFIGFAFSVDGADIAGMDDDPDNLSSFVEFRNEGNKAQAYGVELALDFRPLDWLVLFGNFSFLQIKKDTEVDADGNPKPAKETEEWHNPKVKLNLGGRVVLDIGFNLSVWMNYVSEYSKVMRNPDALFSLTPGQSSTIYQSQGNEAILNARVGWRFWEERLEVGIEGWNLLAPLRDYPRQFPGRTEIVDLDLGPDVQNKQIGNFGGERQNLRIMVFTRLDY